MFDRSKINVHKINYYDTVYLKQFSNYSKVKVKLKLLMLYNSSQNLSDMSNKRITVLLTNLRFLSSLKMFMDIWYLRCTPWWSGIKISRTILSTPTMHCNLFYCEMVLYLLTGSLLNLNISNCSNFVYGWIKKRSMRSWSGSTNNKVTGVTLFVTHNLLLSWST